MQRTVLAILFFLFLSSTAHAHFGLILPSDDIVSGQDSKAFNLELVFMHPFERTYLDMAPPKEFGVLRDGEKSDLLNTLKEDAVNGTRYWRAQYRIRRPGPHIFFMQPVPYWEPAEETFIIHYTKVVVGALGLEQGWDAEVGLPVEIVPLTRPYGLWTGNVFQGIVKQGGKPVAFAEVEVEYLNRQGAVKAPDDAFITQVIRTDANGVFTYAMPREGWWGFAALMEADYKLKHDSKDYPVELGAVLWVRTHTMRSR